MASAMFTYEIKGIPELLKALEQAQTDAPVALATAMWWEMQQTIDLAKTRVPVDTGTLRATGTVFPAVINGENITVEGGFGGAAGSYAVWVHEGRAPHGKMPPSAPIEAWAHRHGIPEDKVFLIRRAIASRGIAPTKYLESAFMDRLPGLETRLAKSITESLKR